MSLRSDVHSTAATGRGVSEARPYVVREASYRDILNLKPNVAVLPWGATEAHNYHLPCGTDVIEADALCERAIARANEQGARCMLLPCIPYGIDHSQLNQFAISMRASTQQMVLRDIVQSLAYQNIDRLVLMNFHGGNEFKSMIRDIIFESPVFIVQVHGYKLNPELPKMLTDASGDHADEFETSLMLHLTPDWVNMSQANDGATTPSSLPTLTATPGTWYVRNWKALTVSTGTGNPAAATAEKGKQILESLAGPLTRLLVELSAAEPGRFPYIHQQPVNPINAPNHDFE